MNKAILAIVMLCMSAASTFGAGPKAVFHTSVGDFTVQLFPDKAPKTVENFIGLAKGTQTWQHPLTREVMSGKPLYDNTVFHRTISGFMIQGGDPLGTDPVNRGMGGPGYTIPDEFSDLRFDKPGLLAMANKSRPNTGSSQFFVTVGTPSHLNNKHTIFGEVISGMDVVLKIANAPNAPGTDAPANPVVIKNIEIIDGAPQASTAKSDKPTSPAK